MKDVVSFHNSYGGFLISGVDDKSRSILGDDYTLDVDDLKKRTAAVTGVDVELRFEKRPIRLRVKSAGGRTSAVKENRTQPGPFSLCTVDAIREECGILSRMSDTLPKMFRPLLWSHDFPRIDPEKHRKTIIVQAVNYDTLEHCGAGSRTTTAPPPSATYSRASQQARSVRKRDDLHRSCCWPTRGTMHLEALNDAGTR
jgi:hypothetical protein